MQSKHATNAISQHAAQQIDLTLFYNMKHKTYQQLNVNTKCNQWVRLVHK